MGPCYRSVVTRRMADPAVHARFTAHLRRDLADGTWDRAHGALRTQPTFEGSLVLVIAS